MDLTRRTIQLDGFDLDVHLVGAGPPLMLVHSLTFDHRMWLRHAKALENRYRLLLVDLHGHGSSGAPDRVYTLEDMADDLATVLDRLGHDQVGYVGHSMGGMVGARLALRHPQRIRALALCNTSAHAEVEAARDMFHHVNETSRGEPPNEQTVQFIMGLMFSDAFRAEHEDVVGPFRDLLYSAANPEGAYRTAHAVLWRTDVSGRLGEITMPTLVVASKGDAAIPVKFGESAAAAIRGATLAVLEGGHLSPVEQHEAFGAALNGFLAEHWGSR